MLCLEEQKKVLGLGELDLPCYPRVAYFGVSKNKFRFKLQGPFSAPGSCLPFLSDTGL